MREVSLLFVSVHFLLGGATSEWQNEYAGSSGAVDCPCINPWEGEAEPFSGNCSDPDKPRATTDGFCVAADYGASTCKKHDCNPERLDCDRQWCYVDRERCNRVFESSFLFEDLSYSYGTCGYSAVPSGNDVSWAGLKLKHHLGGRPLRISFPIDDQHYLRTVPANCSGESCTKTGSYVALVMKILDDLDVPWITVPISETAKWHSPSSYTACVREVDMGGTDLCVGPFWVTPSRSKAVAFTNAIHATTFRMVVSRFEEDEPSFWYKIKSPYVAFTPSLWLVVLALVLMDGVVSFVIEREIEDWDKTQTDDIEGKQQKHKQWPLLLDYIYTASCTLAKASPKSKTPRSPAAKVLWLGYHFSLYLIMASYGASLVFNLLKTGDTRLEFNTVEDVIQAGGSVCLVPPTVMDTVLAAKPILTNNIVEVSLESGQAFSDAMRLMENGSCKAMLMSEEHFQIARRLLPKGAEPQGFLELDDKYYCKKSQTGPAVLTVANAIPIRNDIQKPFSWLISSLVHDGTFRTLDSEAKLALLQPDACARLSQSSDSRKGLSVGDLLGPIMTAVLTFCIALCVWWYRKGSKIATNMIHYSDSDMARLARMLSTSSMLSMNSRSKVASHTRKSQPQVLWDNAISKKEGALVEGGSHAENREKWDDEDGDDD